MIAKTTKNVVTPGNYGAARPWTHGPRLQLETVMAGGRRCCRCSAVVSCVRVFVVVAAAAAAAAAVFFFFFFYPGDDYNSARQPSRQSTAKYVGSRGVDQPGNGI